MATVRPFVALRPPKNLVEKVSAPPYDVLSHAESVALAQGNPVSFLHISRADIDTSEAQIHAPGTYEKSRENLEKFIAAGTLVRDASPCFYIYRQMFRGRVQTGIVGCASVDEYLNGTIKKHELTRKEKELDRIEHFDACSTQTEPVFLAYRRNAKIDKTVNDWVKFHAPEYDFRSDDGVSHVLWKVDSPDAIAAIQHGFSDVPALYIADGHHRTASSAAVSARRRAAHPDFSGNEEFNFLMAVIFCDEDLFIMDYNRVVFDLNGLSETAFLAKISQKFDVAAIPAGTPIAPSQKHEFSMFLGKKWYRLSARAGTFDESDPIASLDCSVLQNNLLAPVLGIADPRTDARIDFVGGIRGLGELERRVGEAKNAAVAFALFPVTMADLFRVADAGKIMPPKSTWFEPKLRSGLFLHEIEK